MFGLDRVDVSIGFPPVEISGSFRPSKAQRIAAWELLVELGSRTTVAPLRPDEGLLREALSSLYQVFAVTRERLRTHGPEAGRTPRNGSLSLGLIALRVHNEILRPTLSRWHPRLKDHEDRKPTGIGPGDWERQWPEGDACRAELNGLRGAVRSYIDTLGRIAGTPEVADSVVPMPPAVVATLDPSPKSRLEGLPSGYLPRNHMVRWWDVLNGIRTVWKVRAGTRSDRARLATTTPGRVPTVDLTGRAEAVVDYVADLGDAFDPTMAVAWQLGRKAITLPADRTGELPHPGAALRKGDLLVLGGDEIYPWATTDGYESQVITPYRLAGIELETHAELALPGNHDYYDDVAAFDRVFVHDGEQGRQDRRWFTAKLRGATALVSASR